MREILFRGKRVDNGDWIYGGCWISKAATRGTKYIIDYKGNSVAVSFGTVGQYTGFEDKKGSKIFEGDVVTFPDEGDSSSYEYKDCFSFENSACVMFNEGRYELIACTEDEDTAVMNDLQDDYQTAFMEVIKTAEIIGNIHDRTKFTLERD